jgi:hypothetical protein
LVDADVVKKFGNSEFLQITAKRWQRDYN